MHSLLRIGQYTVVAAVLAGGLYVLEQMAVSRFPVDPYAPPSQPYVAVGRLGSGSPGHPATISQNAARQLLWFWRYNAE